MAEKKKSAPPKAKKKKAEGAKGKASADKDRRLNQADLHRIDELQDFYDFSPTAYLTLDAKGRFLDVNLTTSVMLKAVKSELVGQSLYDYVVWEDRKILYLHLRRLFKDRKPQSCELRIQDADGKMIHAALESIYGKNRKGLHICRLVMIDITERIRTEQELRKSEEQLRIAIEGGRLGTWNRNLITGEVVWNRYLYNLLGRDPDGPGVTGETFFEYIHPDDIERVSRHVDERLKNGTEFLDEFRIIREDGEMRWMAAAGHVYRNPNGQPVWMAGVNYDITDKKRMEEAVLRSEARYRSFIELTEQLGWVTNANGEVEEDIPSWRKYTGQSDEEIKGWGWSKALHPDDLETTIWAWRRAVAKKSKYEVEYRVRRFDGAYRHFLARAVPVFEEDGSVREWVGTCIDISERKETEELLRRSNEELEKRVQERTTELSQRTAQLARLTSELTLAEHRERRRIAEILHDHLQQLMVGAKMRQEMLIMKIDDVLESSATSVLELINQSIKASRSLSAELSPPVLRSGDLSASLEWLAKWMHENQGFEVNVQTEAGIVLDREDLALLLFQSIRELLLNAVKHSGVKSATVTMGQKDGELKVTVRDRGVGLNLKAGSDAGHDQNFGLISIRERLMHLGGRFDIESAPNMGSTFSLIVPLDDKRSTE